MSVDLVKSRWPAAVVVAVAVAVAVAVVGESDAGRCCRDAVDRGLTTSMLAVSRTASRDEGYLLDVLLGSSDSVSGSGNR